MKKLTEKIQQEAAQCVKCGLCLPYCPTYRLTQNECESPRGRIALMDNLAQEKLPLTAKTKMYLDHCLTCQFCEPVCPANVKYGSLIDHGRTLINEKTNNANKLPWLLTLGIKHPIFLIALAYILRIYQKSGFQTIVRKTRILKKIGGARADELLPPLAKPLVLKAYYPAQNTKQGEVALFTGCINCLVDQETLTATIKILTFCGYDVHVPPAQRCCGALYQHAGFPEQAAKLKHHNQIVFDQKKLSAIITTASGCTAVLINSEMPVRIVDISQFLNTIDWPKNLILLPLAKRVALHTPCTLKNVVKEPNAPFLLLNKIPQIELETLSQNNCCGASGLYMFQYPEISDDLLATVLKPLANLQVDFFATSNIGCSLQLARGLHQQRPKIKILHPVTLIAQQINHNNHNL